MTGKTPDPGGRLRRWFRLFQSLSLDCTTSVANARWGKSTSWTGRVLGPCRYPRFSWIKALYTAVKMWVSLNLIEVELEQLKCCFLDYIGRCIISSDVPNPGSISFSVHFFSSTMSSCLCARYSIYSWWSSTLHKDSLVHFMTLLLQYIINILRDEYGHNIGVKEFERESRLLWYSADDVPHSLKWYSRR